MRGSLTILRDVFHLVVATLVSAKFAGDKYISLSMYQVVSLEITSAIMIVAGSGAIRWEILCTVCAESENVDTRSGCSAAVALLDTACDASANGMRSL